MWGLLLGGFLQMAGSFAGQMVIGAGMAVVTYAGVEASITFLKAGFLSSVQGLPAEVVGMLSLMKVGSCISMVLSAIAMRLSLNGMANGTIKRWVKR